MSNKIKVKLLKAARVRLCDGSSSMICFALTEASYYIPDSEADMEALRHIISERLDGTLTLRTWLERQGIQVIDGYGRRLDVKLRRTRLAWIDSLIKEFSP